MALNVNTDDEVLRTESCAISIVRGWKQTNKQKTKIKKKQPRKSSQQQKWAEKRVKKEFQEEGNI